MPKKRKRPAVEDEVDEAELMADIESALQQPCSPAAGPGTASDSDQPLVTPTKKMKAKRKNKRWQRKLQCPSRSC